MLYYNITIQVISVIQMTKQHLTSLLTALMISTSQLYAEESDHEQHEAHVHGEAQVLIALEGNTIEIELSSPAMNIVGFEHQPRTQSQFQAIESAMQVLKNPERLFSMPEPAKCSSVSTHVESSLSEKDEHNHQHESENEHTEEEHSDFSGHYRFQCEAMEHLTSLEIILFQQFPGTETIEVQSISSQGQQMLELTPENNTFHF